jgi:hypothetical protein
MKKTPIVSAAREEIVMAGVLSLDQSVVRLVCFGFQFKLRHESAVRVDP